MNEFREYVTSTAFKLSLSKVQIEMLCHIEQTGQSWLMLTTFNALAGKGLVERVPQGADHPAGVTVGLTEAGRAVMPLLRLAGLYVEARKWETPESDEAPIDVVVTRKKTPMDA